MDDLKASTSLTAVHMQLIDALSALDEAGEYAAAAHVGAAIDILKSQHGMAAINRADADRDNPVSIIVHAMIDRFGDRAPLVARRQLAEATGSAFLVWAAIANRLTS